MKRHPVKSSNIKSVGYDEEHRVLEIEFTNGGVYHYPDVSHDRYKQLVGAKSVGAHFAEHVRNLKFERGPFVPKPKPEPAKESAA